jgi:hypothetical protein
VVRNRLALPREVREANNYNWLQSMYCDLLQLTRLGANASVFLRTGLGVEL